MGGKVWSEDEERTFWEVVIPQSANAANPEDRKLSWKQCSELMQEKMGKDARRTYTGTMLYEHHYQNFKPGPKSPKANKFLEKYMRDLEWYEKKNAPPPPSTQGDRAPAPVALAPVASAPIASTPVASALVDSALVASSPGPLAPVAPALVGEERLVLSSPIPFRPFTPLGGRPVSPTGLSSPDSFHLFTPHGGHPVSPVELRSPIEFSPPRELPRSRAALDALEERSRRELERARPTRVYHHPLPQRILRYDEPHEIFRTPLPTEPMNFMTLPPLRTFTREIEQRRAVEEAVARMTDPSTAPDFFALQPQGSMFNHASAHERRHPMFGGSGSALADFSKDTYSTTRSTTANSSSSAKRVVNRVHPDSYLQVPPMPTYAPTPMPPHATLPGKRDRDESDEDSDGARQIKRAHQDTSGGPPSPETSDPFMDYKA